MGLLDKAKGLLSEHSDKVDEGVDKAADLAKDKLPDHADKVDQAADAAKSAVDKLDD